MESSKSKNKAFFYDPIRQGWVKETPEEAIRQALLKKMVDELGYHPSSISVEKELHKLPHLSLRSPHEIPKRRADIIVFAPGIHPQYALFPLLLIECKALPLSQKIAQQVISYNDSVQAPFVAIANDTQVWTGYYRKKEHSFHFEEGLLPYKQMLELV